MSFDTSTTSRVRLQVLQSTDDAEYLVVGLARRQAVGQRAGHRLRLKNQAARCVLVAERGQRNSFFDRRLGRSHQRVERARNLACAARDFRHAFLVRVELFQRHHRQEHVVLFEPEKTRRIVQQHVGIEHEEPRRAGRSRFLRYAFAGCGCDSTTASRAAGARPARTAGCGACGARATGASGTTACGGRSGVRRLARGLQRNRRQDGGGLGRCFRKWHQRDDRFIRGNIEGQTSCE